MKICNSHHYFTKFDEWNSKPRCSVTFRFFLNTGKEVFNRLLNAYHKRFYVTLRHFSINKTKPYVCDKDTFGVFW